MIELRWYDGSSDLSGDTFNDWLMTFADECEKARRGRILVDAVQFQMPLEDMDEAWRQRYIIPRYDAAGTRRFAFLVWKEWPAVGDPPAPEGPAEFPTAYFASRATALAWLEGG